MAYYRLGYYSFHILVALIVSRHLGHFFPPFLH